MQPEVQQWLAFAKMDMDTARHLYDTFYPKPLPIICYHCQQAAEKSIKAVIVFVEPSMACHAFMTLNFCYGRLKIPFKFLTSFGIMQML